jgi:hyperosmotically inducible periplasmic protein
MKISSAGLCLVALMAALLGGSACARKQIYVHPLQPPLDSAVLDEQVRSYLHADGLVTGLPIQVNSFRGVVKLDGVVQTEEQREQAGKVTWSVPGVRAVENNLMLPSERR